MLISITISLIIMMGFVYLLLTLKMIMMDGVMVVQRSIEKQTILILGLGALTSIPEIIVLLILLAKRSQIKVRTLTNFTPE
ncbi:MAG: hypothetical protein DRP09_19355, partial [Candidatus Thorarchaeota archaeon]